MNPSGMEHSFDFVLEAGENTDSIFVSFVRVIHTDETSGQLGHGQDIFPDDAWGVYSWFGLNQVSREMV